MAGQQDELMLVKMAHGRQFIRGLHGGEGAEVTWVRSRPH